MYCKRCESELLDPLVLDLCERCLERAYKRPILFDMRNQLYSYYIQISNVIIIKKYLLKYGKLSLRSLLICGGIFLTILIVGIIISAHAQNFIPIVILSLVTAVVPLSIGIKMICKSERQYLVIKPDDRIR